MNMVIPNEGKLYWLDRALNPDANPGEELRVILYTNNYTPVDGSAAGSFTAATFTGSDPWSLLPGDWPAAAIVANVAESTYPDTPTWTNTGATTELCYGWYAVTLLGGIVAAAQRFDSPRNMTPGSVETLDPFKIKLKTFA